MTRSTARELSVQIGFSLGDNAENADEVLERFFDKEYYQTLAVENELFAEYPDKKQLEYIKTVVRGTSEHRAELDEYIEKYSKGWKLSRISRIAAVILRTALFEVLYVEDVPERVAINEAVELAKGYEEQETVAFINGILGSFMRAERGVELPEETAAETELEVAAETEGEQAMDSAVLSVSELNEHIKALLDGDSLLAGVAVRGELSNYKIYPSGHHYFTLKDAECSIRCVMFKGNASKLRFTPENGMGVTAVGRVAVFPRDGAYQLYCAELLSEGMGDLHIAFEQLKNKLSKEGLFDAQYKKPLPRYPKTIAVITSSAGAAVRDIIRVLGKRWPMAKVVILPVRVQGVEAPPEIVGAIRYANKFKVADLIITGRGGGSIEDLWAFNDERVARAIFESEIPVISAVGHEPDVTIADYVADLRAATPSNAAELAVPDMSELRETLASQEVRTLQAMRKKLSELKSRLGDIKDRQVMQNPTAYIYQKRLALDSVHNALISRYERLVSTKKHEYIRYAASLDALSPLKVLARGYSITTDSEGRPVCGADEVAIGDGLRVSLSRGALSCTVKEVFTEPITGGKTDGKG